MQITPFQAIYPNLDYIDSVDSFFENVREEYNEYFESGFFKKTEEEALFIYQIQTNNRAYTGLIACADVHAFLNGEIKKHEATLADKEQKQIQLNLKRKAAVKPILLAYPKVQELQDFLNSYASHHPRFLEVYFELEQATHSFWMIDEPSTIHQIQALFEQHVKTTYIADGHHRTSSVAVLFERLQDPSLDYSHLLSAFFPTSDLEILDFNRVVDGLSETTLTSFMANLSQICDIELLDQPAKPTQKHELTMYINKEWFRLRWKTEIVELYKEFPVILDTMILNRKILEPILGVKDVRTDLRIMYVEGPRGLDGIRQETLKKETNIGFCLYPVEMDELIALADADHTLPPKSTWFEPRMKNGLIVKGF